MDWIRKGLLILGVILAIILYIIIVVLYHILVFPFRWLYFKIKREPYKYIYLDEEWW